MPSILAGSCGASLDRDVLARRVEQTRKAIEDAAAEERRRKEAQVEQQRRRQAEELRRQAEERRRQEITAKSWPDQIKQAVLDRKVHIGMTTEQVMAAWGQPLTVNETIRATSREEQWTYRGSVYLNFSNGTLTTIQRTR